MAQATTPPSRATRGGSRFYLTPEGEHFPSVTSILQVIGKPALIQWAAKEERLLAVETAADLYEDIHGTPKMSRAAFRTSLDSRMGKVRANQKILARETEIGSQVHAMADWNFRRALGQIVGPEPKIQDRAQWAFMALQDWAASVQFRPLLIEQVVWSRTYAYAGTMDLLAEINGVPTLVDFKTGKSIYPEAFLQNVAYQVAYNEMAHEPQAMGGLIVRLPKVETDPAFEVQLVPPVADLFPVFLAARQLWVWWYAGESAYHRRQEQTTAQTDTGAARTISIATRSARDGPGVSGSCTGFPSTLEQGTAPLNPVQTPRDTTGFPGHIIPQGDVAWVPTPLEQLHVQIGELLDAQGKSRTWLQVHAKRTWGLLDPAKMTHEEAMSVIQALGVLAGEQE